MDPAQLDSSFLDEVIPIVFALVICAIIVSAQWLIYRLKRARLEAMKQALIARPDLDPESIIALLGNGQTRRGDMRKALLSLAIGCALLVIGYTLSSDFGVAMLVFSAIPFAIAGSYLIFVALRLQTKP